MLDATHDLQNIHSLDRSPRKQPTYVLMTAAYNEAANIEKTIHSVLSQSLRPDSWVIASDGSTDGTDEIVQNYAAQHSFIRLLRIARRPGRSFAAKARALRNALTLLEDSTPDFIGNLDADVSLDPAYFMNLIGQFEKDPRLGLAGGFVCEELGGEFQSRKTNSAHSVAHAAQLVRRECFDAIGGYAILEYGGEDWYAQTLAAMNGWRAEAFPDLRIFHHRPTGTGGNPLRHLFRQGRMDYSFGSYPAFEVVKCLRRCVERPLFVGGCVRLAGFVWSYLRGSERPVSDEFVAFLRKEQKERVLYPFKHTRTMFQQSTEP